jgi:hypothetical protein
MPAFSEFINTASVDKNYIANIFNYLQELRVRTIIGTAKVFLFFKIAREESAQIQF